MSVSDNFNRANGALGANWSVINGGFSVVSNAAQHDGVTNSAQVVCAIWAANSFGNDHSSQYTCVNLTNYQGPAVRARGHLGGSGLDGYIWFNHGSLQVVQNGGNSQIAGVAGISATDVVKLDATGTTLTLTTNGSAAAGSPVTDSTFSTGGSPGIGGYANGTASGYDDWQGTGEVVASTKAPPPFGSNFGPRFVQRRKVAA